MEGNKIDDLGGGAFKTVDAVKRYSALDQYAMGLLSPSQVPDFFYVDSPTNVVPRRDATSAPEIGVTFNGTRRDLRIEDVIAAMGARNPTSSNSSQRAPAGVHLHWCRPARPWIRHRSQRWTPSVARGSTFFAQATGNRMKAGDLAQVAGASGKLPPS